MKIVKDKTSMIVWLILIALTFLAFFIGWLKTTSSLFVAILLLSTFIKGKLVIDYFMGFSDAQQRWRNFPTIWLFLVVSMIAVLYYMPA
jgi:heme/copper-type cytochrome/quinol oxidase subunit 4